jgi:hypothetical protein
MSRAQPRGPDAADRLNADLQACASAHTQTGCSWGEQTSPSGTRSRPRSAFIANG